MDPDTTLAELRTLIPVLQGGIQTPDECRRAAELFDALDRWLMSGGFLPQVWRQNHGPHFYGMSAPQVWRQNHGPHFYGMSAAEFNQRLSNQEPGRRGEE